MSVERIGVAGAGTMGAGIAQVAALGGYETRLHDPQPEALERGAQRLSEQLAKGAEKGRWSTGEAETASRRITTAAALSELQGCELVIEACPEDLALKHALFGRLAEICGPDAVLATNTSSLSVADIAQGLPHPERICGMHFFNPPALMKLVELIATGETSEEALVRAENVARAMGREPVRCADSPGFIVNRCNRPYALESLRILDEGIAAHDQIDEVMRTDGGYRMGPFELMDLIGIDVNLEVARSFYRQRPVSRWQPHPIQERLVAEGRLGRKSGQGFYDYSEGVGRPDPEPLDAEVRRGILERVVAQLANEASFAAGEGVAEPGDIDSAMRLALNHPKGPFEWVEELGADRVVGILDDLRAATGDERYEVAPLLRGRSTSSRGPQPPGA
ncbi:MAG: 3-hydroxyacyl-CoA dehydrogenase NAD-binding domain-containing protein [Solirubrobacterales bacterium]